MVFAGTNWRCGIKCFLIVVKLIFSCWFGKKTYAKKQLLLPSWFVAHRLHALCAPQGQLFIGTRENTKAENGLSIKQQLVSIWQNNEIVWCIVFAKTEVFVLLPSGHEEIILLDALKHRQHYNLMLMWIRKTLRRGRGKTCCILQKCSLIFLLSHSTFDCEEEMAPCVLCHFSDKSIGAKVQNSQSVNALDYAWGL